MQFEAPEQITDADIRRHKQRQGREHAAAARKAQESGPEWWLDAPDATPTGRKVRACTECKAEGVEAEAWAKGLCGKHYRRMRRALGLERPKVRCESCGQAIRGAR